MSFLIDFNSRGISQWGTWQCTKRTLSEKKKGSKVTLRSWDMAWCHDVLLMRWGSGEKHEQTFCGFQKVNLLTMCHSHTFWKRDRDYHTTTSGWSLFTCESGCDGCGHQQLFTVQFEPKCICHMRVKSWSNANQNIHVAASLTTVGCLSRFCQTWVLCQKTAGADRKRIQHDAITLVISTLPFSICNTAHQLYLFWAASATVCLKWTIAVFVAQTHSDLVQWLVKTVPTTSNYNL